MKNLFNVFYASIIFIAFASSFAEVQMSRIFSDNMMFQRGMPVKVWGTADAGANVEVQFGADKKSVKADANGDWKLHLDRMSASGTPREMTVFENGQLQKTIKNILVGEVWILGGQSNMEWPVAKTTDFEAAKARANYPNIRYFKQRSNFPNEQPQKDFDDSAVWYEAKGDIIGQFSGAGYYFAEQLHKDLNVPVGLVYASRGATSMVCWIPEENFSEQTYLKSMKAEYDEKKAKYTKEVYQKELAEFNEKTAKAKLEDKELAAEGKPAIKRPWNFWIAPLEITPLAIGRTPCYLYNAMVAPINGFAARGVLWYQGEGDSGGESLKNFGEQFEVLVKAWRKTMENEKLFFFWSQLTSIETNSPWEDTRWAQFKVNEKLSRGGVINIIDCGEKNEIHPADKTSVGLRFESLAMRNVYKKPAKAPSPEFSKVEYLGGSARVFFKLYGSNLTERGEPRGFEVLVDDKWIPAEAKLQGNEVILKSSNGGEIKGVRYLWKSWAQPDVWLYNSDGYPLFSFISL